MTLRLTLLALVSTFFIYACSSSSGTVGDTTSGGIFPGWYLSSGFQADSSTFSGFGNAIAADSTRAIERATADAKTQLDLAIGKMAEDVRKSLVNDGVASASNTDFILILRNAHADAINASLVSNTNVIKDGNTFRSFAEVTITRSELVSQLEKGFTGHPRYWGAFSDNPTFRASFSE